MQAGDGERGRGRLEALENSLAKKRKTRNRERAEARQEIGGACDPIPPVIPMSNTHIHSLPANHFAVHVSQEFRSNMTVIVQ